MTDASNNCWCCYLLLCCSDSRTTGLKYNAEKGLRSPPNATRPSYRFSRSKANILRNLGASTEAEVAQAVCGQDAIAGADCLNLLLLGLTPAAYSSNNTADTPRRRAFISPAQVRHTGMSVVAACLGHAKFLALIPVDLAKHQGLTEKTTHQGVTLGGLQASAFLALAHLFMTACFAHQHNATSCAAAGDCLL
jgi:hypothetical protein